MIEEHIQAQCEARTERLMARFNGAIKYMPMLRDHGEHVVDKSQRWSDDECIAFAQKWHAVAIEQLRNGGGWNNGIPYCRNIPTPAMLKEAGRE